MRRVGILKRPPVFVPVEHRREVEKLSKAALMDMVWDYATQLAEGQWSVIDEFRMRREIVLMHRNRRF